jgi:ABC-type sugar transport system permease subunit
VPVVTVRIRITSRPAPLGHTPRITRSRQSTHSQLEVGIVKFAGKRRKRSYTPMGSIGLLFVAPTLLLLLVFVIGPLLVAIYLSLTQWSLIGPPTFVGLSNFQGIWGNDQFVNALVVTGKIAVMIAIPGTLLALVLATLINEGRRTNVFVVLLYVPVIFPSVVSVFIWEAMYSGDGLLNTILHTHINWLTDPNIALWSLALLMLWTNLGYYTVITLAGVRDIPRDYYEAASLDGAGSVARFRWITMPLMRPILLFILMIATTDALTLFIQPYLMTQGGPGDATRTLSELIYEVAFMFTDVGRASAMAVVLLALALIVSGIQFRFFRADKDAR